jgi:hypothetical protein
MALDRPRVRAPEFPPVEWLNTPAPPSPADFLGQVRLVDVWDFTCINCLRTLPLLRDWHGRYLDSGLAMLGVHTPEFPFAHDREAVRSAIGRLGIRWPVALDNHQEIWSAFANRAWPTVYLIDRAGYIRYRREGEGGYVDLEAAIRALLVEAHPEGPSLPSALTFEQGATPDGVCLPVTPELQVESVGNGCLTEEETSRLSLPARRAEGAVYLEGEWHLARRGLTLKSERGEIVLPFQAGAVHAVIAAAGDRPGVGNGEEPAWLEARLDGEQVPLGQFGHDLQRRHGATWLRVETARNYDILQGLGPGLHELHLHLVSPGTTLYAFSFDACPRRGPSPRSNTC